MNATDDARLRVLILETYPTGSHGRVLDLLRRHSAHDVTALHLPKAHWRWLAIGAHYELSAMLCRSGVTSPPHVIIFSGPLNVPAMTMLLPETCRTAKRIVYFHESQWTYPAPANVDERPYLMQHLDAIRTCDEAWFNSSYHLNTFWAAATSTDVDERIRDVARSLAPDLGGRCRVVHPPVGVDEPSNIRREHKQCSLLWNARWEADKRPDLFIALLDTLHARGQPADVIVLGTAGKDPGEIISAIESRCASCIVPGHLDSRRDYERLVGQANVAVSTAGHEFFGIAMLEAALLGVLPVLPNALAYPETLPSAYFYSPGDIDHLAGITARLLSGALPDPAPRMADASRFLPERVVPIWDEHLSRVAGACQITNR